MVLEIVIINASWIILLIGVAIPCSIVLMELIKKIDGIPKIRFSAIFRIFASDVVQTAVIYTTCKEEVEFPIYKMKLPSINIRCDPKTNHYLCKEALPMLNFVIEYYDHFPAKKLIFIHGHETSWHYTANVFETVDRLIHSEQYKTHDYGGIYRNTWHHASRFFFVNAEQNHDFRQLFDELYSDTSVYKYFQQKNISYPCCATFYVNTDLIHRRTLSEYILIRDRLVNWSIRRIARNESTKICSYFMEFSWNMLFDAPYVDYNTAIAN